jgi:hypothetical protein
MGQPPVHEAWLLQYLLVEELYSKMKRKNKQTKKHKKKREYFFIPHYVLWICIFSFKFLPLILLFQRLCIFFLSFFFLTVVKKKIIMHFHVCMSVLSLFLSVTEEVVHEEEETLGADKCIWSEISRQNHQGVSGAEWLGYKQNWKRFYCNSMFFWSLAGSSDWLWLESTCH